MRVDLTEVIWFEQHALSLPELAEIARLPRPVLEELFEYGAIEPIEPIGGAAREPRFGAPALRTARAASRLREDFELETQALAVVLSLLDRVEELQSQLQALQALQPHAHR